LLKSIGVDIRASIPSTVIVWVISFLDLFLFMLKCILGLAKGACKFMNEKKFWTVHRKGTRMLIVCPDCSEWYELPNCDYELKCYRHCPWCGVPLFLKEEDKNGTGNNPVCK
jgi:hypothetical protein